MIYKFWRPGCVPWRMLDEVLQKLPDIMVISVNVEEDRELVEQYGITAVPTLVCRGQKLIGLKSAREIKDWLNKVHEN